MTRPSVAVAIPAFNEAAGIGGFLTEIDAALGCRADVVFVVSDDASTDGTGDVVGQVSDRLAGGVELLRAPANRGHGPTLLDAYRRALELGVDHVVAVDGDGQFTGEDVGRVVDALVAGAPVVCGVRRQRVDPWVRLVLTVALRAYVRIVFGVTARDANCPLRGYRQDRLAELLARVPAGATVPNLHLTVLGAATTPPPTELPVSHRVRRGGGASGTMFDRGSTWRTTRRLAAFSAVAVLESMRVRAQLDR